MLYDYLDTPFGVVLLASDGFALRRLTFQGGRHATQVLPEWKRDRQALAPYIAEIDAYCTGALKEFTIPAIPMGTTFQVSVWHALREIPYGEVITYSELARRVARSSATRAVGATNARNPISIVYPCHRVIGVGGHLTGYGGGLAVKAALLEHERRFL